MDEIIRQAMEHGEFDNLKNQGKPLDLSDYFETPEDLRIGYALLKSADIPPEEVSLLQEIAALKEQYAQAQPEERSFISKKILDLTLKFNLLQERKKKR
jgi:hypothetical protein